MSERVNRQRPAVTILCLLVTVFTGLYYWSPLIRAEWSMADDHEIFRFIGDREHLPMGEIPNVMRTQPEIARMGSALRFSPAYNALTLLQASVFGKNPSAWYAFHVAIAVVFSVVLCLVGLRVASPIAVLGFMTYELSRPYWSDIFARLGATEAYAALGLSIIAVAVMTGLNRKFTGGVCAALAIGLVIAAGSKENFVLFAAVPVWLLTMRAPAVSFAGKIWLVIAILYTAFIAAVVLNGVSHAGHDFYFHSISIGNTLRVIGQMFQQITVWIWLAGVCAFWLAVRMQVQRGRIGSAESLILNRYVLVLGLLLLVYAAQMVFYSGQDVIDHNEGRYPFLQTLAKDFALLIASVIVLRVAFDPANRDASGIGFGGVFAAYFLIAALPVWNQNRLRAEQRVQESSEFTRKMEGGAAYLKDHPAAVLLLNSHHPIDFEPVLSIMEFMRSAGVSNAIAIKTNDYCSRANSTDPLLPMIASELEDIQTKGRPGSTFAPLASITNTSNCYSFGLSGLPAAQCEHAEIAWPPGQSVEWHAYPGGVISFSKTANGASYLASGWSVPEDWGVWSNGCVATLAVKGTSTPLHSNMELVVNARGFVTQEQATQLVHVKINERDAGALSLTSNFASTVLQVPPEALQASSLKIDLIPENPLSPALIGTSSDRRLLGIGLRSVELREADSREERLISLE